MIKRKVGWASIGHPVRLCVKCKKELHGNLEIDYHILKTHKIKKTDAWINFYLNELKVLNSCMFIIADCREERKIVLPGRNKW